MLARANRVLHYREINFDRVTSHCLSKMVTRDRGSIPRSHRANSITKIRASLSILASKRYDPSIYFQRFRWIFYIVACIVPRMSHIHRVLKTLNISFTPGDNCNFHITKHFPCILDSFSKSTLSFLSRQHFSQAHVDLVNCKSERKMMFLKFCLCLRNLSSFFSNANETYAPFKNRSWIQQLKKLWKQWSGFRSSLYRILHNGIDVRIRWCVGACWSGSFQIPSATIRNL